MAKNRFLLSKYPFLLVSSVIIAACFGPSSNVQDWMEEQSRGLSPNLPPLPPVNVFVPLKYASGSLGDPFSARKILPERVDLGKNTPDLDRPKEQLEIYELNSISLVGLLRDKDSLEGVVSAGGKIFRVRRGSYLGKDFGQIKQIKVSPQLDEGSLIVLEKIQATTGEWVDREVILNLKSARN